MKNQKLFIFIMVVFLCLNFWCLYKISEKVYKYNKVNYEAMVCLQDKECTLEPIE